MKDEYLGHFASIYHYTPDQVGDLAHLDFLRLVSMIDSIVEARRVSAEAGVTSSW